VPIRQPHVAGLFYPGDPTSLKQYFKKNLSQDASVRRARAIILPHAGYEYSGITAGRVISKVTIPGRNFLIGPNHRSVGAPFALSNRSAWNTPLGDALIKLDNGVDVGHVILEAGVAGLADDGEGMHPAASVALDPVHIAGHAVGALLPWVPEDVVACLAVGEDQLVALGCLPERLGEAGVERSTMKLEVLRAASTFGGVALSRAFGTTL